MSPKVEQGHPQRAPRKPYKKAKEIIQTLRTQNGAPQSRARSPPESPERASNKSKGHNPNLRNTKRDGVSQTVVAELTTLR